MLIESGQLLANCYTSEILAQAPKTQTGNIRKYSHKNHPCSLWAKSNILHFNWLLCHSLSICHEYHHRFNKIHFTTTFIQWCNRNRANLPIINWADPPRAFGDFQSSHTNTCDAYRAYYTARKVFDKNNKLMAKWTNRTPPAWF